MLSAGWSVSARFPFCVEGPWSLAVARATFGGRGSADPSACSRSSSSEPAGEDGVPSSVVLLRLLFAPSCEHAEAEKGDFPAAKIPHAAFKVAPAPGGCPDGGAAARLPSASVSAESCVPWDSIVLSVFFGVCCIHSAG
jgi:hypothetical protein